jgi:hypothetical protein
MITRFVDIDGTICITPGTDYEEAEPIRERIEKFNAFFDAGDVIVYWSARGAKTGRDWTELTYQQLKQWGAKYHSVRFDKPLFDVLYDDKAEKIDPPPVGLPVPG